MVTYTLSQIVYRGDLILAYGPDKAHMFLVKSGLGSSDTIPSASSIIGQKVNWHIPDQKGFWVMSGPEVRYIEEGEADHKFCICDDHSDDHPETTLDHFLDSLGPTDTNENEKQQDVSFIVNPHGRYVLPLLSRPSLQVSPEPLPGQPH
jgi:hypothetical protein